MIEVRDSAKVKAHKSRACVYVAGALFAIIPSRTNICNAQQPITRHYLYREYVNQRYGYSICYPEGIFVPQGEPPSRDGQVFLAQDGAELRVHADYNVSYKSIQDDFKDTISDENRKGVVTFKLQKGNSYAVSGKNSGNIFYRKTILEGGQFITFRAVYPETASAVYGDVITAVSKCLKSLKPN